MMRAAMEDSASVRQRKASSRGTRAAGLRSLKMSVVGVLGTRKADGSSIGDGVDVEAGVNVRLVGNEVVYAIGDTLEITDSRLDRARS